MWLPSLYYQITRPVLCGYQAYTVITKLVLCGQYACIILTDLYYVFIIPVFCVSLYSVCT